MADTRLAPRELPGDEYSWWIENFMALDCQLNTLLGGWHHETLSSRAWRAWSNAKLFGRISRPIIDVLFVWQSFRLDHCVRHFESEVARADQIVKARTK